MKKVVSFLKALQKNNNKPWFDEHRTDYDAARGEFIAQVEDLIKRLTKIDPVIGNPLPKECVFRINRDVRFSKNKNPYKNNMSAVFASGGKKSPRPCYYVHIQPGNSFIAGGMWMPEKELLEKVRQEIDYEGKSLQAILKKASFKKYFSGLDEEEKLVRMPKGYEEDHPMAELIKLKSFTVTHAVSDAQVLQNDFPDYASKVFAQIKPFNEFLSVVFEK
ncbi:MAG TPA: DUF2461 domain-containing protein [Cytophagaceae bacterium]|jgi:uncharacterized protein (TIGR02453 family)|nr:DUF2461 domain-containing protein [Cytophagaceae bacterium]